jgi:hypothetical protein
LKKQLAIPYWAYFIACLFSISSQNSYAQGSKIDSATIKQYIQGFHDQVHLKIGQSTDIENLSQSSGQLNYLLSPNNSSVTRLNFSYRFISFSLRFIPKFIPGNNDIETKGNTVSNGLGFNFSHKQIFTQLSYHKTQGYYLENSPDFVPGWRSGDKYLQFPDLQYKEYSANFFYRTNPLFSFNALMNQTERQLKSVGTWLPGISIRNYIIDNQGNSNGSSSQRSNNFEYMLSAGYQYTKVINKSWFGTLGFTPAIGLLNVKLLTRLPSGDITSKEKNTVYRLRGIGGIGYQTNKWYAGGSANWNYLTYKQENSNVQNREDKFSYQIYFGIRLRSPKYLTAKTTAVEHLIEK